MPELADKVTRSLFGKAAIVGLTFGRSVRTRIVDYFRRFGRLGWQGHLQAWILEPMSVMRDHLHHTFMSAWIEGYDWVWGKLPPYIKGELERPYRPPIILPPGTEQPPQEPPAINARFAEGPEEIRFPKIEEAARRLIERNVLSRDQFDAASDRIRNDAFTMAGDMELDAIQTVQETIARDIAQGTSLGSFEDQLSERLETSRLGAGHLENVYRTNVQSAFRDGRESLASNPIVSETFPYQEYIHIGDSRVRSTHAQMSKLGLDGTGIYRRDDPVWDRFTPPWDFNSIATGEKVTTARGQIPIEQVIPGDVVLTHNGNWRPVLGIHASKGPSQLVVVETDEGSTMRLTAEHRVFTERGWIEAGSLKVGEKVYEHWDSSAPNLVAREIEDVSKSERVDNVIVPLPIGENLISLDFDSYAKLRNVEIEPVGGCGLVEHVHNTTLAQLRRYERFVLAHWGVCVDMNLGADQMGALPGSDHSVANLGPIARGEPFLSGCKSRLSLGAAFVADQLSLRKIPHLNLVEIKDAPQRAVANTRDSENITKRCALPIITKHSGKPTRPGVFDSLFGLYSVSRRSLRLLADRHSHPLKTTQVNSVQQQSYHGLVHDISVAGDASFCVNNIAVSNCRCTVRLVTIEAAARAGVSEAKLWLETGRPPINPEHRINHIPFEHNPGWGSRGRTGVLV